jgi:LemA protein
MIIALILVLVLFAGLVLWGVGAYNRLVKLRNLCEEAWAGIDVQLTRRHDLIPNLVETVKGYASHEKETLERVIQARQTAVAAQGPQDQAQAENFLTGALRQLFALSESYPDLKADTNFRELQAELTATEGLLANSRNTYNAAVRTYETARQTVPTNIIAGMFNFVQRDYFEVDDPDAREPVRVEF